MKDSTKMFLEGTETEEKVYCVSKENLLTLREYLMMLKKKNRKFKHFAYEEIDMAKRSLKWIKDIEFGGVQDEKTGGFIDTTIRLITIENDVYTLRYDQESMLYEPVDNKVPMIYRFLPSVRRFNKRMEELYKIQPNLKSIEHTGRVAFNNCLFQRKSISGHFTINYDAGYEFIVNDDEYEPIVAMYDRKGKHQVKPYLTGEESEKILDLIQIENRNLPNLNEPCNVAVYIFADPEKIKKYKYTRNENDNKEN